MPYDGKFWKDYEEYLLEKAVRANHNMMFERWKRLTKVPLHVVDLGCGIGEYRRYGKPSTYLGVDTVDSGRVPNIVIADYTDPALLSATLPTSDPPPNAFVSLFSIESCYPAEQRYRIYEAIFAAFPSINWGLVSGFFYVDKCDQKVVEETGDLKSFQTIETPAQYPTKSFTQFWESMFTPSKMFGPSVPVEVWKFFTRQPPPEIPNFYGATSSHGSPGLPK